MKQKQSSLGAYVFRTCVFAVPGAGVIGVITALIDRLAASLFILTVAVAMVGGLLVGTGIAALNHRRFVRPIESIVRYISQVRAATTRRLSTNRSPVGSMEFQ